MEDDRQWFTCPNCGGKFWRFHPVAVDYVIDIIQCPKCLRLWDVREGEPKEYERIPVDGKRRTT